MSSCRSETRLLHLKNRCMQDQELISATESGLPASVAEKAARHLHAGREDVVVTNLAGDASTRRYFRMRRERQFASPAGSGAGWKPALPGAALESNGHDETVIVSLYPATF